MRCPALLLALSATFAVGCGAPAMPCGPRAALRTETLALSVQRLERRTLRDAQGVELASDRSAPSAAFVLHVHVHADGCRWLDVRGAERGRDILELDGDGTPTSGARIPATVASALRRLSRHPDDPKPRMVERGDPPGSELQLTLRRRAPDRGEALLGHLWRHPQAVHPWRGWLLHRTRQSRELPKGQRLTIDSTLMLSLTDETGSFSPDPQTAADGASSDVSPGSGTPAPRTAPAPGPAPRR